MTQYIARLIYYYREQCCFALFFQTKETYDIIDTFIFCDATYETLFLSVES